MSQLKLHLGMVVSDGIDTIDSYMLLHIFQSSKGWFTTCNSNSTPKAENSMWLQTNWQPDKQINPFNVLTLFYV
jgi:hypothetical protein